MSKQQRLVLVFSILASFVAFLDGAIVNVALTAIQRDISLHQALTTASVSAFHLGMMVVAGSVISLLWIRNPQKV